MSEALERLVPLRRCLNKYFLLAAQCAEREVVNLVRTHGPDDFDLKATTYYQLRTGRANWITPGVADLPKGLEREPVYWVMPWCEKRRAPETFRDRRYRIRKFPLLFKDFCTLIAGVSKEGYDSERGRVPVIELVCPGGEEKRLG